MYIVRLKKIAIKLIAYKISYVCHIQIDTKYECARIQDGMKRKRYHFLIIENSRFEHFNLSAPQSIAHVLLWPDRYYSNWFYLSFSRGKKLAFSFHYDLMFALKRNFCETFSTPNFIIQMQMQIQIKIWKCKRELTHSSCSRSSSALKMGCISIKMHKMW